jgi:uncharacterized protein (DUF1330 family)
MSGVLIIASLRFKDIAHYRIYEAQFPAVFAKFDGRVLAADEQPQTLGGDAVDKVVVLHFPSEEAAHAFTGSAEYLEISKNRDAGADTTSWQIRAFI